MNKLLKFGALAGILAFLFVGCDLLTGGKNSNNEAEYKDMTPAEADAFRNGIKDVQTFISSEEEFVSVMADISTYIAGMKNSEPEPSDDSATPASYYAARSALTAEDASEQVNQFLQAALEQVAAVKTSLEGVDGIENAKFKINFDKSVDIGSMASKEWIKVLDGIYTSLSALDSKKDGEADENPFAISDEKAVSMGFQNANDFYAFFDEVLLLKKFYVALKTDVDFDGSKFSADCTDEVGSAKVSADTAVTILDVEKLVKRFYGAQIEQKLSIPLKAVALNLAGNSDLAVSYCDLYNAYELIGNFFTAAFSEEEEFTPDWSKFKDVTFNLNLALKTKSAVCTKDGLGGIVKIDVTSAVKMEDILTVLEESTKVEAEGENVTNSLTPVALLDGLISIRIAVSDGSTDTFSKEYKPSELAALGIADSPAM